MLFDWLGLLLTSGDNDGSNVGLLDVDPVAVVPEMRRVSVSFARMLFDWLGLSVNGGDNDLGSVQLAEWEFCDVMLAVVLSEHVDGVDEPARKVVLELVAVVDAEMLHFVKDRDKLFVL